MINQVICSICRNPSERIESFLDLQLEITASDSLEQALATYTAPEVFHGSNQYKCNKCNVLVNATKTVGFVNGPQILSIQLKRFGINSNGSTTKDSHPVSFNEKLDINITPSNSLDESNSHYTLVGVVCHAGARLGNGHYFSFLKSSTGNEW